MVARTHRTTSGVSRRAFMRLVGFAAGGGLLAACSPSAPSAPPAAATTAAAPKPTSAPPAPAQAAPTSAACSDHTHRLKPANGDVSRLLSKAAVNLAAQSLQRNETTQARDYLLRAVEASPGDPELHRKLGEVYELRGDHAAAQHEREQASRPGPP